jgi:hypothetical protein
MDINMTDTAEKENEAFLTKIGQVASKPKPTVKKEEE